MHEDPPGHEAPPGHRPTKENARGSGIVFAIIAIALILAIAFFYMAKERRQDRRTDALMQAAGSVDETTRIVGDAAKNAADALRNDDR